MFLFRKNIILVPSDYDGMSLTKGLVSFDCYDSKTKCSLHCYNLNTEKPLVLGVSINNKLHKVSVPKNYIKNFQFEIQTVIGAENEISVVLLDVRDEDYDIVLWGSTQISNDWKTSLDLMILDSDIVPHQKRFKDNEREVEDNVNSQKDFGEKIDNSTTKTFCNPSNQYFENLEKSEEKTQKNDIFGQKNSNFFQNYDNFSQNQAEFLDQKSNSNLQDCNQSFAQKDKDDCCNQAQQFEKYAYNEGEINDYINHILDLTEHKNQNTISVESQHEESPKVVQENFEHQNNDSFFERINPQIEKMFATSKSMDVLNEIIPNSKFCRVDFDDGSGYYVFGVIYDEGSPKYLCYGMPAKKDSEPPKELSNLYQWLPVDAEDEFGDGFYMMYQDASTGENISVDIV